MGPKSLSNRYRPNPPLYDCSSADTAQLVLATESKIASDIQWLNRNEYESPQQKFPADDSNRSAITAPKPNDL